MGWGKKIRCVYSHHLNLEEFTTLFLNAKIPQPLFPKKVSSIPHGGFTSMISGSQNLHQAFEPLGFAVTGRATSRGWSHQMIMSLVYYFLKPHSYTPGNRPPGLWIWTGGLHESEPCNHLLPIGTEYTQGDLLYAQKQNGFLELVLQRVAQWAPVALGSPC